MRIVALTCSVVHTVIARYAKRKDICNFETDSALKDRSCNETTVIRGQIDPIPQNVNYSPQLFWIDLLCLLISARTRLR